MKLTEEEKKARKATYNKTYREAHLELIVIKERAYQESHKVEIAARNKAYREAHRDILCAQKAAYRELHRAEAAAKTRLWRESRKDRAVATVRAWRGTHQDYNRIRYAANCDLMKQQARLWRQANGARRAVYERLYCASHREQRRALAESWRARNPDQYRQLIKRGNTRRRLRMEATRCDLTGAQWEAIKRSQGYRCAACSEVKPLTQDHIIPVKRGGEHTALNIQALCLTCNLQKGTRIIDYRSGIREAEWRQLGLPLGG